MRTRTASIAALALVSAFAHEALAQETRPQEQAQIQVPPITVTAPRPVAEAITPILTCDWAGVAKAARTTDKAKAVRVNFIICRAD